MKTILPALLLGMALAFPLSAQAVEIDADTELQLLCGVGYLLVSADPAMENTKQEEARLRQMGETLLNLADDTLAAQNVSTAEREEIGRRYTLQVDAAFDNNTDLGFDPDQCAMLVADAEATALDGEIDKYMTCGAGFLATAGVSQDAGDSETAAKLEALGEELANYAEELMVEAGYGEEARFQIGQMYGVSIGTKVQAGEELDYDWDTCAALGT